MEKKLNNFGSQFQNRQVAEPCKTIRFVCSVLTPPSNRTCLNVVLMYEGKIYRVLLCFNHNLGTVFSLQILSQNQQQPQNNRLIFCFFFKETYHLQ
jgi:hypothetical protein